MSDTSSSPVPVPAPSQAPSPSPSPTLSINTNNYLVDKINSTTKIIIVEYIFIDGFNTTRSKTRIIQGKIYPEQEEQGLMFNIDIWNVDGSSTGQSTTNQSDIILVPRTIFKDPFNTDTLEYKYYLCMCEILNIDGTPHISNNRAVLYKTMMQIGESKIIDTEPLFGIEQEYVIIESDGKTPYKWTNDIANSEQGKYYCSVGGDRNFGREIAMEHMNKCIQAGIMICGINSEVAPSQWEFQIGICNSFQMGDHLWIARYILSRVAELHNAYISYDPKPFGTNWNGSGAHTNFSTKLMRNDGGIEHIKIAINKLSIKHHVHMAVYGEGNERRLTGSHETSDINTFTYGDCDRSSSIRIPVNVKIEGKGYLEDRRPASNIDPYLVCGQILKTILCDD
jgi:glutamine synthetase